MCLTKECFNICTFPDSITLMGRLFQGEMTLLEKEHYPILLFGFGVYSL